MKSDKITLTDEQLIDRYYQLNSCTKLAKELNVSKSCITIKLRKLEANLSKRGYNVKDTGNHL